MNEMVSSPTKAKVSLEPDEAVELWLQGKDAWNKWVEENPEADVSFSGVDFSAHCKESGYISFRYFIFPTGNISFEGSKFGNKNVDFSYCDFGDGDVDFCSVNFGEKDVKFLNAKFGKGDIYFEGAIFSDRNILIISTEFNDGDFIFSNVRLGGGYFKFKNNSFGKGRVDFINTDFSNIVAVFFETNFGEGSVDFREANFINANLIFYYTIFGKGLVSLSNSDFSGTFLDFSKSKFLGELSFHESKFGKDKKYIFDQVEFSDAVHFTNIKSEKNICLISFNGSNFKSYFNISGEIDCVPDLIQAKISHQISVHGLKCSLKRKGKLFLKAEDPEDEARLRRLKELAEDNKDHESALAFHADEMRARRWNNVGTWGSLLDLAFDKTSDYGRSISQPFLWLLAINLWCTLLYYMLCTSSLKNWMLSLQLSLTNTFPFLPTAKAIRDSCIKELFGGLNDVVWLNMAFIAQGLLSFIFLFLIGLGLRNRFRI